METLRATAERRKIAEIARMPKLKITYCLQQNYRELKKLWIKILIKKKYIYIYTKRNNKNEIS